MKRLASMLGELKLYGMIAMIVTTVWVCALEGHVTQAVEQTRYWPAIAPAANQAVVAADAGEEIAD